MKTKNPGKVFNRMFLKGTSKTSETDSTSALLLIAKRPVGIVSGDVLIAHIATDPGVQITAPIGWSYLSADTLTGDQTCCYSRIADKNDPEEYEWSFVPKDGRASIEIRAFSGLAPAWSRRVRRWFGLPDPQGEESVVVGGELPSVLDEKHFQGSTFPQQLVPDDVKVRSVSRSETLPAKTSEEASETIRDNDIS